MNSSRSRFQPTIRSLIIAIALLTLAPGVRAVSWKEKVLYSFQGIPDGATPAGGVVFDQAGNLYGATTNGGANNCLGITQCGIVYQLQPPTKEDKPWTENILYVFKGVNSNDGETPAGGVLFDQGNLYGTTAYGGSGGCMLFGGRVGCGTVYKLVPPKQKGGAWTESVIYSFKDGKDGYLPQGDLTFDKQGNLYGATQYGGGFGSCNAPFYQYCGTVFKLSSPKTKGGKWTEKVLYAFKSGKDGANPNGGLVFDSRGALYGTTFFGGNQGCGASSGIGCGTVFELSPPVSTGRAWTEKLLLRFKADASMGGNPTVGVIFRADDELYGTTTFGGQGSSAAGTVFSLLHEKSGSWNETLLHTFPVSGYGGWTPLGGVIFDTKGNLYGTASGGGASGAGTVFQLAPSTGRGKNWAYTVIYSFGRFPDAGAPESNLIFDKAVNLYGTTSYGGSGSACQGGCGAVFELKPLNPNREGTSSWVAREASHFNGRTL